MLHILWGILKIILIVAGILAGLAAVLLLLVLFCPIRYQLSGVCKEGITVGKVGISWLFHLIWVSVAYEEKKLSYQIRILGISLETYQKIASRFAKKTKQIRKKKTGDSLDEGDSVRSNEEHKQFEERTVVPAVKQKEDQEKEERCAPGFWKKFRLFFVQIGRLICRIFAAALRWILWIWHIPVRIYQGIHKIVLTISEFCGNIEKWKAFIENERVRTALGLVFGNGKRLLKHVFPTKTQGWILFGFEDPSVTGQILAAAGMTCPIHQNRIELRPNFEEKVFESDVKIRGRVRLFVVLKEGLELYFDKNVKYMMNVWKKEA